MCEQDYEQLTLFPEDSHASRFPSPGSDEARRMTVTSGRKCSALSKSSSPLGSLERMLLGSSIWNSTRCWLIWKPQATKQGRLLFRLVPSTPRTAATDARLWATPTARDSKGANSLEHLATGNHVDQLANAVKLIPTPTARCGQTPCIHGEGGMNMATYVKLIPTVTTGSGMCGGSANYQRLKEMEDAGIISAEERRSMEAGNGGQLNPDWVEWLMGFPIGWTSL